MRRAAILLSFLAMSSTRVAYAVAIEWTQDEINNLSAAFAREGIDMSPAGIAQLVANLQSSDEIHSAFRTDTGVHHVKIVGKTVWLDGKDLTTPASRTIVGDINNSQVTMGDQSPIQTRHYSLSVPVTISAALSLAITLGFAASAIRKRRARRKR